MDGILLDDVLQQDVSHVLPVDGYCGQCACLVVQRFGIMNALALEQGEV